MTLDGTYAYWTTVVFASYDKRFSGIINTNRTDVTLLCKATANKFYDNAYTDICEYDGTRMALNQHAVMNGQSISNATQLSALSYVHTPTVRKNKN